MVFFCFDFQFVAESSLLFQHSVEMLIYMFFVVVVFFVFFSVLNH